MENDDLAYLCGMIACLLAVALELALSPPITYYHLLCNLFGIVLLGFLIKVLGDIRS